MSSNYRKYYMSIGWTYEVPVHLSAEATEDALQEAFREDMEQWVGRLSDMRTTIEPVDNE